MLTAPVMHEILFGDTGAALPTAALRQKYLRVLNLLQSEYDLTDIRRMVRLRIDEKWEKFCADGRRLRIFARGEILEVHPRFSYFIEEEEPPKKAPRKTDWPSDSPEYRAEKRRAAHSALDSAIDSTSEDFPTPQPYTNGDSAESASRANERTNVERSFYKKDVNERTSTNERTNVAAPSVESATLTQIDAQSVMQRLVREGKSHKPNQNITPRRAADLVANFGLERCAEVLSWLPYAHAKIAAAWIEDTLRHNWPAPKDFLLAQQEALNLPVVIEGGQGRQGREARPDLERPDLAHEQQSVTPQSTPQTHFVESDHSAHDEASHGDRWANPPPPGWADSLKRDTG